VRKSFFAEIFLFKELREKEKSRRPSTRRASSRRRTFFLGKLNQSPNLRWLGVCRVSRVRHAPPQAFTWPWSRFFVQRARILVSHGRTRCPVYSPAPVAIANNVLKAGRYGTGLLNARMLFGEALTNF